MSIDSAAGRLEQRRMLKNPLREIGSPTRRDVAIRVAHLYAPPVSAIEQVDGIPQADRDSWIDILKSTSTTKNTVIGVLKIKELLEIAQKETSMREGAADLEISDFADSAVATFLLDIFSKDPRLTEVAHDKRLDEIFGRISIDLFGKQPSQRNVPMKGRAESIKHYFSSKKLYDAVDFFLIEPALLPQVPMQQ